MPDPTALAFDDIRHMDRSVTRIPKRQQALADLAFWRSRPMAERIAAVEALRLQVSIAGETPPMLNRDFKEFVELLDARGVEYLVVGGVGLNIIGLEDFRSNKRASGRLKDLADLEALEPATRSDTDGAPTS